MAYYALYVGNSATENLELGLAQGIWGFKESHEFFNKLESGDNVVLGYDVSYPVDIFGQKPPGFPRVKPGKFQGKFKKIILVQVVGDTFVEYKNQVWSDDIYPFRFNFSIINSIESVSISFNEKPSLCEALRYSATTKGWLRPIDATDWPIEVQDIVLSEENDQPGWVYALMHPNWQGWTKIGCTIDTDARLYAYHTSVPDRSHYYISKIRVEQAYDAEQQILDSMRKHCDMNQISHSHEWFKIKFDESTLTKNALNLGIEILEDN
tara:strand:+ start:167 stop:964 length:798 start_codon:yes stop_codon:yes gene_type:complete